MDSCLNSVFGSVSPFDCLLFDLDDTLYSSDTGIGKALKQNVQDFLVEKCKFPESEVVNVNREFFRNYGSSLAALRASGYDINPDEYHSYVHGRLPYDSILPNIRLRNILKTIEQRKMLFFYDNVKNVAAGKAVGFRSVLVGQAIKSKEADYALETITNMVQLIPEIWQKEESDKIILSARSEMDLVLVGA
ncbi:phosphate metabolism protein 8-like isoform X2 [Primulina eburnea]|uniref:phosphate metabolism protein 8-like isoform X2 n=1 Tax=Primulina eburnea TaxID=1245227 RepID=UPI003C6C214A